MGMNHALIGKTYDALEPFPITREGAEAYAAATEATGIEAYQGPEAVSPPMYGVAFTFAALCAPLFDPALRVDMMRIVHGEQDMRFLLPVRPGDVVRSQAKVLQIVEKASGEVVDIGVTATNHHGDVVLETRSGLFVRGPRKREGREGEPKKPDPDDEAFAQAPKLWTASQHVALDQSRRYADASGDKNPIHLDEELARSVGLSGIILHGLCTMAFVHNACTRQRGCDPTRVKRLSVRFARPVVLDQTLTIEARGDKDGPWRLQVTNPSGAAVLKCSVAEVA